MVVDPVVWDGRLEEATDGSCPQLAPSRARSYAGPRGGPGQETGSGCWPTLSVSLVPDRATAFYQG